jgi:hypothetical protein
VVLELLLSFVARFTLIYIYARPQLEPLRQRGPGQRCACDLTGAGPLSQVAGKFAFGVMAASAATFLFWSTAGVHLFPQVSGMNTSMPGA